ncbi:RadC family protein [Brevibacillus reuszeri]|uniref:RadC family protein n=1 Tax=Brevibacillus reuszeri TaxID=54915 RepID=UPI003D24FAF8
MANYKTESNDLFSVTNDVNEYCLPKSYVQKARESVANYGIEHCDLHELFAVIIGNKAKPQVCARLSQIDIHLLAEMTIQELCDISGVTYEIAVSIVGAFGLAKKLSARRPKGTIIYQPSDVAELMMEELRHLKQEHFVCLFLNTKNKVLAKKTIFKGSLDASIVHPREIFKEAVKLSCSSIICVHNHPSGNQFPSSEDIEITNNLRITGETIGIPVIDHIIIGDGHYYSLNEQGHM